MSGVLEGKNTEVVDGRLATFSGAWDDGDSRFGGYERERYTGSDFSGCQDSFNNTPPPGRILAKFLVWITLVLCSSLVLTKAAVAESMLNINITRAAASLDLAVMSENGTFASSEASSSVGFSVYTTNETGYTLRLLGESTSLTAENSNGFSFSSITSIVSQSTFEADTVEAGDNYNGKWGWKPNKYVENGTVATNTNNFLPAPGETGTIIDITSTADGATESAAAINANEYTIALGARAELTTPATSYGATFVLEVVANEPPEEEEVYTITYSLNGGTNNANNPATYTASSLPIILQDPTRDNYIFSGWYETSDFSGTAVTTIANRAENVTLYAKWESSIKKYSNDCLTSLTSDYTASVNKDNINTIHGWTIKYKTYERYGSTAESPITSDEWLFLYAGPNTDPDTGQQDGENHIVLMTKYIANNIKYYSSAITNRTTANTFTSNKDNWAALYALNDNDYAYGTVKSVRANSSATDIWAEINYRWYVGFGLFAYDKNETYSRSDYYAFGNNQSISRSGNSEYDSGIGYGTRPMVYLGTDKKITEIEDADYYGVIVDETVSTCPALGSDSTNGVGEETE